MSRIGKKPITVPSGVDVTIDGQHVAVKGPKGTLELDIPGKIAIDREGEDLVVTRPDDARTSPLTSRASVDFPDPLAPITATRGSVRVSEVGARISRSPRPGSGTRTDAASKWIVGKSQRRCSSCGKARCTSAAIIATSEVFTTSPIQNGMS